MIVVSVCVIPRKAAEFVSGIRSTITPDPPAKVSREIPPPSPPFPVLTVPAASPVESSPAPLPPTALVTEDPVIEDATPIPPAAHAVFPLAELAPAPPAPPPPPPVAADP